MGTFVLIKNAECLASSRSVARGPDSPILHNRSGAKYARRLAKPKARKAREGKENEMTPYESENENGRRTQFWGGGRARKPKGGNSRGPCSPPRCAPYLPPGVTTSTSTSTSVCPHAKALAGDTTQGPLAQSTPIQTCRATLPHHALPALLRRTRHGV